MLFKYLRHKWKEWKAEKQRRRTEAERAAAHTIWRVYYESKTMDNVSMMSGIQFEEFLARLFLRMGYTNITLTPSNDQGGDLLCHSPSGIPLVIQAKRWTGAVGNDAVQELLGAMRHYGRTRGIVVTNSTFTRSARQLAGTGPDVTLCDRLWLEEQLRKFFPPEIPEFNQEDLNRIVRELGELTRTASTNYSISGRFRRRVRDDFTLTGMLMQAGAVKGKELTSEEILRIARIHAEISDSQTKLDDAAKAWQNTDKEPAGLRPSAGDNRKPGETEWKREEYQPKKTEQDPKGPQLRAGAEGTAESAAGGGGPANEHSAAGERRFGEPVSESERRKVTIGGGSGNGETPLPRRLTTSPNTQLDDKPFRLLLPQALYHDIIRHALTDFPTICCGLLAGKVEGSAGQVTKLYRVVNDSTITREYFGELRSMFAAIRDMRRCSLDILAVYSSRPNSEPVPSQIDLERNFRPEVMNLIISVKEQPHVRAWWLRANEYREASWECVADVAVGQVAPSLPQNALSFYERGTACLDKKEYDLAIEYLNEALRLDPNYAAAFNNCGMAWLRKNNHEEAIRNIESAIRLDSSYAAEIPVGNGTEQRVVRARLQPINWFFFATRGLARLRKGEIDEAIREFDEAIRLDPKSILAYAHRGKAWIEKKEYEKAVHDFEEAIRLKPEDAESLARLAWLLATCPQGETRDGRRAVETALRACHLTEWKSGWNLNVLAAAFAETGQFDEAERYQRKALEDPDFASDAEFVQHLELYRQKTPFHQAN
jgi:tetratricopeptide (TPR) repeat protein